MASISISSMSAACAARALTYVPPVSSASKKVIAIFERLQANLSACSYCASGSRTQLATKALSLLSFQHEVEVLDPREYKKVLGALHCAHKYLPTGVRFEKASCDQLETALNGLFHEFNNPSIPATIPEEDVDTEFDSDGTTETDLTTVHDVSPTASETTSPASIGREEDRSPIFAAVAPERRIEACPSSPKFSKMCQHRGLESGSEVGFKASPAAPKGKDVLGILYFNISQMDTFGMGKKKVEATILSLIHQAKQLILSNPRRDPVDLYALVQLCTTYIPYVQQNKYLPENESLSVDVCLTALQAVIDSWDILILEEAAERAAAEEIDSPLAENETPVMPVAAETHASAAKEPFENLMNELQYISLLGYESDELETEIFDLITKTKNTIFANPEREPVEIYALHAFCLRYLPQGEPLKIETTIAALTSLLEDFDKLVAEERASVTS